MDTQWRYWRVYPTQEQAFEAHAAHARARDLIVTAMDYTLDAKKQYAVASLLSAYEHCLDRIEPREANPYGAHQYELLMPKVALRLYFDAEFLVPLNAKRVGSECLDALVHYIQRAYHEIPNRPVAELTRDQLCIETSHRADVKVSYHGKLALACGVAADMTAQRAFWARVMQLVEEDVRLCKDRALLLKVKSKRRRANGPDEEVDAWFWDSSVYTKHRLMRFLGACKFPAPGTARSYLVPEGVARGDISFDMWHSALVTAQYHAAADAAVVLDMPRAWFALMERYWKTPVVPAEAASAGRKTRTSEAALSAYLRHSYPSGALERMWTMGGRVALKYRHLALTSTTEKYVHHFQHETIPALLQSMHGFGAGIVHVGAATGEGSPGVADPGLAYGHYALRELCFDLDVTDYDEGKGDRPGVRWCACKGQATMCADCWYFAEAAALFLRDMLVRRMGIDEERHVLWVFSGGKGLHVWVNAPECLFMTPAERAHLLARYVDVDLEATLRDPVLASLFERLLVPHFVEHAVNRRALLWSKRAEAIVEQWASWFDDSMPRVAMALRNATLDTREDASSLKNWQRLIKNIADWNAVAPGAPSPIHWIVAQYAWPRLDSKVTTKPRGTLKAPFSIHAGTQLVSVPIAYPGDGCREAAQLHTLRVTDEASIKSIRTAPLFAAGLSRLERWLQGYTV
jgi:DNA primase catalytic subunit